MNETQQQTFTLLLAALLLILLISQGWRQVWKTAFGRGTPEPPVHNPLKDIPMIGGAISAPSPKAQL